MAKRPLHGIHSFIHSFTHTQALWPVGHVWPVLACVSAHVPHPRPLRRGGLGLLCSLPSLVPGTHSTDMVYDDE